MPIMEMVLVALVTTGACQLRGLAAMCPRIQITRLGRPTSAVVKARETLLRLVRYSKHSHSHRSRQQLLGRTAQQGIFA